jgi:hypothetical protein
LDAAAPLTENWEPTVSTTVTPVAAGTMIAAPMVPKICCS